MKVLLDMNVSPQWQTILTSAGFEAVHWSQIGSANDPDDELIRFAKATGHLIFTHDLDFGIWLARSKSNGPSVVQVRTEDILPSSISDRVIAAFFQLERELEAGALVTIDPIRLRVRLLPFN